MRIGINLPLADVAGRPLDSDGVAESARAIEGAGLDGIWLDDELAGVGRPDPLMMLLLAAAATSGIEIGSAHLIVPIRNPVDLAYRMCTMRALSKGRFTAGVGMQASPASYAAVGADFDGREDLFRDHMDTVRRLCNGEAIGAANVNPWPEVLGGPPFILSASPGRDAARDAAANFDGWMCPIAHSNLRLVTQSVTEYREAGGRRALATGCGIDLAASGGALLDSDTFDLRCSPDVARQRLAELAEIGFDDVIIVPSVPSDAVGVGRAPWSPDELAEIRASRQCDEAVHVVPSAQNAHRRAALVSGALTLAPTRCSIVEKASLR